MRLPLPVARALVFLISRPIGPPLPVRFQRLWLEAMSTGGILPPGTTVERVRLGGCPAERIVPAGADSRRAVLLLHGGRSSSARPGPTACSPRTSPRPSARR